MMGFRRKERIDRAETDGRGRGRRREENLGITHSILSMRALRVGAQLLCCKSYSKRSNWSDDDDDEERRPGGAARARDIAPARR